jgi:hypothetical protein
MPSNNQGKLQSNPDSSGHSQSDPLFHIRDFYKTKVQSMVGERDHQRLRDGSPEGFSISAKKVNKMRDDGEGSGKWNIQACVHVYLIRAIWNLSQRMTRLQIILCKDGQE